MKYDLVLTTDYRPRVMFATNGDEVPHLNGYPYKAGKFSGGTSIQIQHRSVSSTIRQVWTSVAEIGFRIADQRPPVLPLTHHWVDSSTSHGIILAERDVAIIPASLLEHQRYRSSALLVTIEADPKASSATGASMEKVVPQILQVQAGRVLSKFGRGKHHRWRTIESVEIEPWLEPFVARLTFDLRAIGKKET